MELTIKQNVYLHSNSKLLITFLLDLIQLLINDT